MKTTRRPATLKDEDLLFHIKSHSLKPYVTQSYGWDEEMQQRIHSQNFDPKSITIIQVEGQAIGYLQVQSINKTIRKIENLLIHKSFQSKGIGSLIIKQEIEAAHLANQKLELQVFKNNPRALKFYQSKGFEVIETTDTHFVMQV